MKIYVYFISFYSLNEFIKIHMTRQDGLAKLNNKWNDRIKWYLVEVEVGFGAGYCLALFIKVQHYIITTGH
jgi:predicted CDP-diglyceride synthetase/phosphatidate cytidylyltransferase